MARGSAIYGLGGGERIGFRQTWLLQEVGRPGKVELENIGFVIIHYCFVLFNVSESFSLR